MSKATARLALPICWLSRCKLYVKCQINLNSAKAGPPHGSYHGTWQKYQKSHVPTGLLITETFAMNKVIFFSDAFRNSILLHIIVEPTDVLLICFSLLATSQLCSDQTSISVVKTIFCIRWNADETSMFCNQHFVFPMFSISSRRKSQWFTLPPG